MIRIAVCNDTKAFLDEFSAAINGWKESVRLNVQFFPFLTEEEMFFEAERVGQLDLVFIVICPEREKHGIDMALSLKAEYKGTEVVFVSAIRRLFERIFEVRPLDFLKKPIYRQELYHILERYLEIRKKQFFPVYSRQRLFLVPIMDIVSLNHKNKVLSVKCRDGKSYDTYMRLGEAESLLAVSDHHFEKIHNCCIVNPYYVQSVSRSEICMYDGEILPVSRPNSKRILTYYSSWYTCSKRSKIVKNG
ncbi:MAG: response regulator transcription factor [Lachnospiraceae bacterium]|nr:response regulator transcription factor [Lachnospiraceae bacterium]